MRWLLPILLCLLAASCTRPGTELARKGDEIMIAGRLFHTGAPVVLWTDPGGYDAYRVEKRFVPFAESSWQKSGAGLDSPNRFNLRFERAADATFTPQQLEQIRGGGWDLHLLQQHVDQFVIHYDVCGTSRTCFRVLHDMRGLSVHFLLDIDGTIYQTLDLKERAWHATSSNDRSVGIEIAHIGAYATGEKDPFDQWYSRTPAAGPAGTVGSTDLRITIPSRLGDGGVRTPGFVARPARSDMILGDIHGRQLRQYDFTPEQYDSLTRLVATLCTVLPRIRCDYPRDESGMLLRTVLPPDQLETYSGVLGHFHIQKNKIDPGPAFDWDRVILGARRLAR
ncbi:MAG: N-acetylmuramoyl-L-alanine amidase [Leptolyngbya sp. PLA1]|nr:N-acetylmuramoyl-L-alanine amidase [Leptolyngbya sp. PLA1]